MTKQVELHFNGTTLKIDSGYLGTLIAGGLAVLEAKIESEGKGAAPDLEWIYQAQDVCAEACSIISLIDPSYPTDDDVPF